MDIDQTDSLLVLIVGACKQHWTGKTKENRESCLGGKFFLPIPKGDSATLLDLVQASGTDTKVAGVFVWSVFISNHGFQGPLYRVGEHCLVNNTDDQTMVVEISAVFAVKIQGAYHQFLKEKEYWQASDYSGSLRHVYNENPIVVTSEAESIFFTTDIIWKVTLYPNHESSYVLIDDLRPHIPLTLCLYGLKKMTW